MLAYDIQELNHLDCAISTIKVALELFPQSSNAWDTLGEFYYEKKEYHDCILAMKKSLELDLDNDNALDFIDQSKKHII